MVVALFTTTLRSHRFHSNCAWWLYRLLRKLFTDIVFLQSVVALAAFAEPRASPPVFPSTDIDSRDRTEKTFN